MITVQKSNTADTRTCDVATVSKHTLMKSSLSHIQDVGKGLSFFSSMLHDAAVVHDYDKLTMIDWFYSNFKTSFDQDDWWVNHRKIHRHHLNNEDGIPTDVNLIDILEYITDCTMAGMARKGEIYDIEISDELLMTAFENTATLLKDQIKIGS